MAINGDVVQVQRERTIDQLRKGKLDILVATDVAARGLDVDADQPRDQPRHPDRHRVLRAPHRPHRPRRRPGDAISFVTPREGHLLRAIEKTNRTTLDRDAAADGRGRQRVPGLQVHRRDQAGARGPAAGAVPRARATTSTTTTCPALDIAAAIAVLAQDGEPLLIEDDARAGHGRRHQERANDDARRASRWRRTGSRSGKRHRVEPRQIVGALANEGGLSREDFGKIDIRPAFSIVELPADLPPETLRALEDTRISGVLIDLKPDRFAKNRGPARPAHERRPHSAAPGAKKPRHKKRDA